MIDYSYIETKPANQSHGVQIFIAQPVRELSGIYARHLRAEGFEAIECFTESDIYPSLRLYFPHAVLFDLALAGERWRVVMTDIMKVWAHSKIITMSDYLEEGDINSLLGLGVNHHLDRRTSLAKDVLRTVKQIL